MINRLDRIYNSPEGIEARKRERNSLIAAIVGIVAMSVFMTYGIPAMVKLFN